MRHHGMVFRHTFFRVPTCSVARSEMDFIVWTPRVCYALRVYMRQVHDRYRRHRLSISSTCNLGCTETSCRCICAVYAHLCKHVHPATRACAYVALFCVSVLKETGHFPNARHTVVHFVAHTHTCIRNCLFGVVVWGCCTPQRPFQMGTFKCSINIIFATHSIVMRVEFAVLLKVLKDTQWCDTHSHHYFN